MHQNIMWSYYIRKVKEKELEKIKVDIKDNIKDNIIGAKDDKKDKALIRNESWDSFVKLHIPWIL